MLAIRGKARALVLSATLATTTEQFLTFGYMFGMYKSLDIGRTQIGKDMAEGLNKVLVPQYASAIRLSKKERAKMFASTIDIETYALHEGVAARIEELWAFYEKSGNNMKRQHRIKRIVEQYLVLALEARIKNCIEAGNAVILYLNYRKSVAYAAELFDTTCIIEGDQDPDDRECNIARFQANKEPIIICNVRAGGVGLDLDDCIGDRERMLFLRPGSEAKQTKQALERPNRLTAKSASQRFIIFADTPFERRWRDRMSQNIAFLDRLNDSDMSPLAVKLAGK
jgi:hypothetical protein